MKRHIPLIIGYGLLFLFCALPGRLAADASPTANPTKLYDESADGNKQVADAVFLAGNQHKRVLLQFGANWCSWCRRLHALFDRDDAIRAELKADYVVVLIDVNKKHNSDLVAKYGAEKYGLPFLVVLDSDGKHLVTKHSDDFEEGDHHNPEKVLVFLKEWAPKPK